MQSVTFVFLAAAVTVACAAAGQYYVPRAYYTIDAEGHESAPVPLRRLRREIAPYPYSYYPRPRGGGGSAEANAIAITNGGGSSRANANAQYDGSGYNPYAPPGAVNWDLPRNNGYGAANPAALGSYRRFGSVPAGATGVVSGSSAVLGSDGKGYYDNYAGFNGRR